MVKMKLRIDAFCKIRIFAGAKLTLVASTRIG